MAGAFFARFIPPTKKDLRFSKPSEALQKRKRGPYSQVTDASTPPPSPKKQKKSEGVPSSSNKEVYKKDKRFRSVVDDSVQKAPDGEETNASTPADETETISSEGKKDLAKRQSVKCDPRKIEASPDITKTEDIILQNGTPENLVQNGKSSKRERKQRSKRLEVNGSDAEIASVKHSKILSRFKKSTVESKVIQNDPLNVAGNVKGTNEAIEPVVAHGLEPLPQPLLAASDSDEKPSYSSLPPWLAKPLTISADRRVKFADLGIDTKLLKILDDHGYKEAFAVQSTVIPLLLPTPSYHPGDLCISAATGSGKTLSYVLPMIKALDTSTATRLRGLIVVPTRELVKQARETCELCAAGTGLRVGTALGNVAIRDEQRTLMRVDSVYDPQSSAEQQQNYMKAEHWTQFNLQDYVSEIKGLNVPLPGYVSRREPNVDILISTPGRLVDHIRFTKGFNLHHLQWLVIDEADRLLNESFQEWVDVVMNFLDIGRSFDVFGATGKFLSNFGISMSRKHPRKVVLSATMTKDVSKLNSLRLVNPKLVVIGASETEKLADPQHSTAKIEDVALITLPPTLKEHSVPAGDGSEKPLYLLRVLLHHIGVDPNTKNALRRRASLQKSWVVDSSHHASSSDSSDSLSSPSLSDSESSSGESTPSSDYKPATSSPNENIARVLVFTRSSEAASRLSRLLSLLCPSIASKVGTIIKSSKSSASRKTLSSYRQGKVTIIIATDRASRGLDLPSLTHVINYDVPTSLTVYVHRVGRTARAGSKGSAWTLVTHGEGKWFSATITKDSDGKIVRPGAMERVNVKLDSMKDIKQEYGAALDRLETEVKTDFRSKRPSRTDRAIVGS
ncbi:P-loop containing nucleoside triphosphate hydrolase protein [Elaphomyces granulatus]